MKYIRVRWKHTNPDEPVWIFCELTDDREEMRKLECFKNGFCDFASSTDSSGTTKLNSGRLPDISELARDSEFEPKEITKEEFEEVWKIRRYKSTLE